MREYGFDFNKVFVAACLGMFLFGIVIITLGTTLPSLILKFQLSEIKVGSLASVLPFGILVGSILFGPIVDRYSYKYLLGSSAFLILIGMEVIAFTNQLPILQAAVFLIGLGGGAINGGTNALVADISALKPEKRSANLSLLGVFFGVGAFGMPLLTGVLSERYSGESILATVGILLLLPILYFASIQFPQAKQHQGFPIKEALRVGKDKGLILLGLVLFFQSGIEGIVNNWTTIYLQSKNDLVQSEALYALSLFVLSLTITRLLLVIVLNRFRPYQVMIFSVVVVFSGVLALNFASTSSNDIVGLILLGSGLAAGFPVVLGYVGELYPKMSGTAFSLVFVVALTGNILLNFLTGVISQNQGIGVYSKLLMVCVLCLSILLAQSLKNISNKIKI